MSAKTTRNRWVPSNTCFKRTNNKATLADLSGRVIIHLDNAEDMAHFKACHFPSGSDWKKHLLRWANEP